LLAAWKKGEPPPMLAKFRLAVVAIAFAVAGCTSGWARDFRITIPRHSELTPVQRLNREGVDAVNKHQYEKAEGFFYKAYLYDASDPFTLNNLGYISELQGKLSRAQKFYAMAAEQDSTAVIDLSNAKTLQGKPMTYALTSVKNVPLQVNRMNVEAVQLLSQNRNYEAGDILHQALALQPDNPFTINNLGVAEEATGNFEDALKHYDEAAASSSNEPVVVTLEYSWRGKPVSEMAADSAKRLRSRIQNIGTAQARSNMLAYRGVAALNRNDWTAARQDFLHAYSVDPNNAFALNNRGYVAEKEGDLETAQFFYSQAQKASDANATIGLATQRSAEGQHLIGIAEESHGKVDGALNQYREAARRQTGPIELIPRGNAAKPATPPQKPAQPNPAPQE
jgi:tetratricopeptide (TPR) repeat protein